MKDYPLYEVRNLVSIRDMVAQSVELYGDKPAFLVKREKGGPYIAVSYRRWTWTWRHLVLCCCKEDFPGKK